MKLSLDAMRSYLSKSISSFNRNKLNGLLAEVDFRNELIRLGFEDRVSIGGWIVRSTGSGRFGHDTVVMFPETLLPDMDYEENRPMAQPSIGLHTICATFHQLGIRSYFCAPSILQDGDPFSISWNAVELGIPTISRYQPFPECIEGFKPRERAYNFLRYKTDVTSVPALAIPEEYSKEALRIAFQSECFAETSDIDGIFWGKENTYPMEIKEKTAAPNDKLGEWFGIDVGPFVKLAYFAAKRGNLHSLFVVREIDDVVSRNLVAWRFITFETLARFASWIQQAGGTSMGGGMSAVVKIPKAEFREMTKANLDLL